MEIITTLTITIVETSKITVTKIMVIITKIPNYDN